MRKQQIITENSIQHARQTVFQCVNKNVFWRRSKAVIIIIRCTFVRDERNRTQSEHQHSIYMLSSAWKRICSTVFSVHCWQLKQSIHSFGHNQGVVQPAVLSTDLDDFITFHAMANWHGQLNTQQSTRDKMCMCIEHLAWYWPHRPPNNIKHTHHFPQPSQMPLTSAWQSQSARVVAGYANRNVRFPSCSKQNNGVYLAL